MVSFWYYCSLVTIFDPVDSIEKPAVRSDTQKKMSIKQHETNEPRKDVMTEHETRIISKHIKDVKYSLFLSLDKTKTYIGAVVIDFHLISLDFDNLDLFLNFGGGSITNFVINKHFYSDIATSKHVWQDNRIFLHKKSLKLGHNEIRITFENAYNHTERGLSRIVDTDGLIYCYSNCEPFGIHNIFPCFDVISTRAEFQLRILVPASWTVISNETPLSVCLEDYAEAWNVEDLAVPIDELLDEVEIKSAYRLNCMPEETKKDDSELRLLWKFKKIKNICSYLFAFFAGPYTKVSFPDEKRKFSHNYYARESLKTFLEDQNKDIHFLVEAGLEYLEDMFGVAYPYSKLDHIFCPEFLSVGMENPGAISLCDEEFLFREVPTPAQLYRQAFIVIHELVHMWLGDLLSVEWLNDVWVKESLASFFAADCIENNPRFQSKFPDAWYRFALYKAKALEDDLNPEASHPIADLQTPDTKIGSSCNFDLIVYHKGSGVFKQIFEIIGRDLMKPIMRNFVQNNAGKSITRKKLYESFYEVLKEAKKDSLMAGVHQWLETKGTDRIHVLRKQEADGKQEIHFTLDRHEKTSNRPHYLKVLVITKEGTSVFPLKLLQGENQATISVENDVLAVLPNYYDDDFIISVLDEATIHYFAENQAEIKDKLIIQVFWFNIFQMVASGELKLESFYDLVSKGIDLEIQSDLNNTEYLVEDYALEKLFYFIEKKCDFREASSKALDFTDRYLKHLALVKEKQPFHSILVKRIVTVFAKQLLSVKALLGMYHEEGKNIFKEVLGDDVWLRLELLKEGYFRGEAKMVELRNAIDRDHTKWYEPKLRYHKCVEVFGGAGKELLLKDLVKLADRLRVKEWTELLKWKYQLSRHAWMKNPESYYAPEFTELIQELKQNVPRMLNEAQIEIFEEELSPRFLSTKAN